MSWYTSVYYIRHAIIVVQNFICMLCWGERENKMWRMFFKDGGWSM
jgi:hypothetical protein